MDAIKYWTRVLWPGILLTILSSAVAIVYVAWRGPLYDVWGWKQITLILLIVIITVVAGVASLLRAPNPYSRAEARYELRDIAPHSALDSGGSGWLLQAIPLVGAAIALTLWMLIY